jgi:hypothetical protein
METARAQRAVVSRTQALEAGLASTTIGSLLRSGRWLALQRGVYRIWAGQPAREAILWAATLRAGTDAVLSHQTAAELHRLYAEESTLIHISVPEPRHIAAIAGVVIHRSSRLAETAQLNLSPPRTRIEDTVLDLADSAADFEAAFSVACAACQKRLTTASRLLAAMSRRRKMRWRSELTPALAEIESGVHSRLEYRYVRRVEQPHGLPKASRQAKIILDGRTRYLDGRYDKYAVGVELDGRQAHRDERRWLDIERDNAAAAEGLTILRYGWTDVTSRPCRTAAEVGAVLRSRGWAGAVRACGPQCLADSIGLPKSGLAREDHSNVHRRAG